MLNAYVAETFDAARARAAESDARLKQGTARPLEGIPLGIKDLFATRGVHTQACSRILQGFRPTYESTVTANLWRDGALMLGKQYGRVRHGLVERGPLLRPGDQSMERAAPQPVAGAGRVVGRLGHGGRGPSLRRGHGNRHRRIDPSAGGDRDGRSEADLWAVLALGIVAFASSLDQAGPIARDVTDAAIMLRSMAGYDPMDSTSVDLPVPDYEAALARDIKGLRVGIPREYRVDNMPPEIDALWKRGAAWLKDRGAEIVDISLPHTKYALPAYYIVAPAEASSISPVMTACATASGFRATTSCRCMRTRVPRASAPRCGAGC